MPMYQPNPVSEWKAKEQFCDVGRRMGARGFVAGQHGEISYRLAENRFLISAGETVLGNLKSDDICAANGEGKQIGGKRKCPEEMGLHLAIYKARPDVRAIIHAQPPHATAFAVAGIDLPTCVYPGADAFLGAVKTAQYFSDDKQRAEAMLPMVKDSTVVLLQNEGVICFGGDLEQCYQRLETLDAYARILILAKQVGSIRALQGNAMTVSASSNAEPKKVICNNDFLQRVGSPGVGERGVVATAGGAAKVTGNGNQLQKAIGQMAPANYSESDIDQLVQIITDQIMASV